jgi:hypothetical protein
MEELLRQNGFSPHPFIRASADVPQLIAGGQDAARHPVPQHLSGAGDRRDVLSIQERVPVGSRGRTSGALLRVRGPSGPRLPIGYTADLAPAGIELRTARLARVRGILTRKADNATTQDDLTAVRARAELRRW